MSVVLLTSMVNASNHTKCISLSNQQYTIQPTLINLHQINILEDSVTIHLQLI